MGSLEVKALRKVKEPRSALQVLSGRTSLWSCFFFFSSRRRHTRLPCDWSSDVCSSDLGERAGGSVSGAGRVAAIVLAAGQGTRLGGRAKAALVLPDGRSFVAAIMAAARAAGVAPVVVVA